MKLIFRPLFISTILLLLVHANSGILEISWPKPNPKQEKPSIPYPKVLTKNIKNTKLPVYIPSHYRYDKKMSVIASNYFYTIIFEEGKHIISIAGDRTFQEERPANRDFEKIVKKSQEVEFTQEEGMMSADFNRHGVNYSITVECEEPKSDPHCTSELFVTNLYNQLIMVGGHP